MRRASLVAVIAIGCGHAAPAPSPAAAPAEARRACVHGAELAPASCIDAASRGKLLKDDHDLGLRIWQACDGDAITGGAYVAERVGNGQTLPAEMTALLGAHRKEVMATGALGADVRACGGAGAARCIEVEFVTPNEDVPAVAANLLRIFATEQDVCLPFRIDTGVAPGN